MRTNVTAASQPYRLRERLQEARISHDEESRVDIKGVRVTATSSPLATLQHWVRPDSARTMEGVIYFCAMGPIGVREVLHQGDGRPLPDSVELDGFDVEESGVYDILNGLVQCNGKIRVVVDRDSSVERAVGLAHSY